MHSTEQETTTRIAMSLHRSRVFFVLFSASVRAHLRRTLLASYYKRSSNHMSKSAIDDSLPLFANTYDQARYFPFAFDRDAYTFNLRSVSQMIRSLRNREASSIDRPIIHRSSHSPSNALDESSFNLL